MIAAYSPSINRREMDAVLTCMVDEKIGPGALNIKCVDYLKEVSGCRDAVLLRSLLVGLDTVLTALGVDHALPILASGLVSSDYFCALSSLGYKILALDVDSTSLFPTMDTILKGVEQGGRVLLLDGVPDSSIDFAKLKERGVFVIADISTSIASFLGGENQDDSDGDSISQDDVLAGFAYCILRCEECNTITAGGGVALVSFDASYASVLSNVAKKLPACERLPDLNSALFLTELKNYRKYEAIRAGLYLQYMQSASRSGCKVLSRGAGHQFFVVLLKSSFAEVQKYATKKGVEVVRVFSASAVLTDDNVALSCPNAKSVAMRAVLFPLYPRLSQNDIKLITRVLSTLP